MKVRHWLRVGAGVVACLLAFPALAYEPVDDLQLWLPVTVQTRLQAPTTSSSPSPSSPSPFLGWFELQPRLSAGGASHVALFRGALGAEVVPGLSAWLGIAAVPTYRAPSWEADEVRLFQQLQYIHTIAEVQLIVRGRLEERSFPDREVPWRGRSMVRGMWRPAFLGGAHGLVVWDEPFVTMSPTPGGAAVAFDQNRFFAGVRIVPVERFLFEIGYLNILIGVPGPDTGAMRHAASASLVVDLF